MHCIIICPPLPLQNHHHRQHPLQKQQAKGSIQQQQYDYIPFMNEQNLPIIDYRNEEICEKILVDEL